MRAGRDMGEVLGRVEGQGKGEGRGMGEGRDTGGGLGKVADPDMGEAWGRMVVGRSGR